MPEFLKMLLQVPGIWLMPFALVAFVFLSLLLFVGELPDAMRRYFLPSLAVFLLGLGLIIFAKELYHLRYNAERTALGSDANRNLPWPKLRWFVWSVGGWFLLLIVYNFWRGVL